MSTRYDKRIRPFEGRKVEEPCAYAADGEEAYCCSCLDDIFGGGYSFWYQTLKVQAEHWYWHWNQLPAGFDTEKAKELRPVLTAYAYDRHFPQVKEVTDACRRWNGENRHSSKFVRRSWIVNEVNWKQVTSGIRFPEWGPSLVEAGIGL